MILRAFLLLTFCAAALPAAAEPYETRVGGDRLVAGGRLDDASPSTRDLLVSGAQVVTRGDVGDDLFAAGFSVDVEGASGGDVTAAGARVRIDGEVGGDAMLSGFIVTLDRGAEVAGNARLFAGTATLRGTVSGAAIVSASEIRIDGVVAGDLRLVGDEITFGPDASVAGQLTISAPREVAIPAHVAPAARITYEYLEPGGWREFDELAWEGMPEAPSAAAIGIGFFVTLAFLLVVGGTFLALAPNGVATMRRMALNRPGITVLVGGLGFSTLIGLVPVSALSIVALPLLPMALLAVILAWILGYLLGAYVLAMGIARALGLGDMPSLWVRLGVLAAAIAVAALLNFVPLLGWVLNVALVFFGLGAITEGLLRWAMPGVGPAENDEMLRSEADT
ncbi:polymer-forming cytoskeletal protein [uncultured Jannaschia sp.]|uniref:polymer-forming cytoskeletal protein n=1 Tax=uncultured Jannaschia sp. TaxID=293347 RepID=UPI00260D58A8|nr:polymer-forming cytoskeletal protein [uncultured Jannaschia sp.]